MSPRFNDRAPPVSSRFQRISTEERRAMDAERVRALRLRTLLDQEMERRAEQRELLLGGGRHARRGLDQAVERGFVECGGGSGERVG